MKILIVDDEKIVRRGIISLLRQSVPDVQVAEASNGEAAIEIVKVFFPSVVITDVKMPIVDGIELTKMVHAFDSNIKIIVLSSYDDYTYVRQCMKYGAVDYLLKPLDMHELLSILNLLNIPEDVTADASYVESNEWIDDAKNYIRRHYSDNISSSMVAAYVHLNPSYFSSLFNQKIGKSFSDFLNEIRMQHAKQLLLNPNIKIYEVGEKVGFSDSSSFNRAFKRAEGVSPSKFREQFSIL